MINLKNRTRKSGSIPKRLVKEGRFYLVPIYYLMLTSFLAEEGIKNSGSYRFADHIYVSKAKGKYVVGKFLDKILLLLPSSRSFKKRYEHTRDSIIKKLDTSEKSSHSVMSIPSGIPRELVEAAQHIKTTRPHIYAKTTFYCVDGDEGVLAEARAYVDSLGLTNFEFIHGDAMNKDTYPENIDCIVSTGFNEFINDEELRMFFEHCKSSLAIDGLFATSLTRKHLVSDYLMKHIAELHVNYRDEDTLKNHLESSDVQNTEVFRDSVGYQILMKVQK